jgi:K+-transporting ATPase ATPase A chain
MEGKETRFGPEASALMTVGTMGTTAGATDSALDSYTPVGGTGAFAGILLGEISPGGDGGGLYSILVLALLAVFVAGLMAGSLAGARVHARTRATLDTAGPTFVAFLIGVIVIVGGLIYFPMLILGPIGERFIG